MSMNYGPEGPQQPFQPQDPWRPKRGFLIQPPHSQQPIPQQDFPGQPQNQWQQPQPPIPPPMFQQPPLQPTQPVLPQKPLPLKQWFSAQKRSTKIGCGCGIIFLVLMLCTCSVAAYGSTLSKKTASSTPIVNNTTGSLAQTIPTPTQQPAPTPTDIPTATQQPAPTPTDIPTPIPTDPPTATPIPSGYTATYGTPLLGGLISDFVGKYGQPNDHSSPTMYHFLRTATGPTVADGLIVSDILGTKNVDGVLVAPINGAVWTSTTAQTICMAYAPTDAQKVNQIQLASANGYDVIYSSSWLATRFSADNFTDANQNTVQAGTFDVMYLVNADGSIDSCNMQLGSQQTQ